MFFIILGEEMALEEIGTVLKIYSGGETEKINTLLNAGWREGTGKNGYFFFNNRRDIGDMGTNIE